MPDDLIAELRRLVDTAPLDELRRHVAALPHEDVTALVVMLVVTDAAWRAADEPASEKPVTPPGGPDELAAALDFARRLGDAIEDIDSIDGVVTAAFDGVVGRRSAPDRV